LFTSRPNEKNASAHGEQGFGRVERVLCEVATSHMARRTFVGNLYQQVQDPNLIGKMSGHVEGSAAFARYRRIEDETLRRVIKRIE